MEERSKPYKSMRESHFRLRGKAVSGVAKGNQFFSILREVFIEIFKNTVRIDALSGVTNNERMPMICGKFITVHRRLEFTIESRNESELLFIIKNNKKRRKI